MTNIIASFFCFVGAIIALLVVKRKWPLKFKTAEEKNGWYKRHYKRSKVFAIILFICGVLELLIGLRILFPR